MPEYNKGDLMGTHTLTFYNDFIRLLIAHGFLRSWAFIGSSPD